MSRRRSLSLSNSADDTLHRRGVLVPSIQQEVSLDLQVVDLCGRFGINLDRSGRLKDVDLEDDRHPRWGIHRASDVTTSTYTKDDMERIANELIMAQSELLSKLLSLIVSSQSQSNRTHKTLASVIMVNDPWTCKQLYTLSSDGKEIIKLDTVKSIQATMGKGRIPFHPADERKWVVLGPGAGQGLIWVKRTLRAFDTRVYGRNTVLWIMEGIDDDDDDDGNGMERTDILSKRKGSKCPPSPNKFACVIDYCSSEFIPPTVRPELLAVSGLTRQQIMVRCKSWLVRSLSDHLSVRPRMIYVTLLEDERKSSSRDRLIRWQQHYMEIGQEARSSGSERERSAVRPSLGEKENKLLVRRRSNSVGGEDMVRCRLPTLSRRSSSMGIPTRRMSISTFTLPNPKEKDKQTAIDSETVKEENVRVVKRSEGNEVDDGGQDAEVDQYNIPVVEGQGEKTEVDSIDNIPVVQLWPKEREIVTFRGRKPRARGVVPRRVA
ncbi:hypothetical protein TREMEDRAFT_66464 [Tremella mesenterica DSM 1558]|uniref:uncharacterized protein n=1 Tax=Tremella mesenterica (strain ATCC 24925 / CBS 8224 / DSM 1558 / NBRC 9311 / NRRL Y-6157 / RJB 2259-6 / UBC 559-6) TaxID=578456 RepID=UPI00032D58C5|nr:uncharacterized protein TREMEDRAFT_66464 [Tremella mesenterica DSM 1558]EIW65551.1 hypothetical protein TREMEDRAFT_66464 [Tremella mesenterica DSM 1558]